MLETEAYEAYCRNAFVTNFSLVYPETLPLRQFALSYLMPQSSRGTIHFFNFPNYQTFRRDTMLLLFQLNRRLSKKPNRRRTKIQMFKPYSSTSNCFWITIPISRQPSADCGWPANATVRKEIPSISKQINSWYLH